MKRRHIAVVTNMGHGHVYPVLPLCMELVKRGHRITFVSTDQYARIVCETGAEPIPYKSEPIPGEVIETIRIGLGGGIDDPRAKEAWNLMQLHFFSDTEAMLFQVQPFYEKNFPDVVLYDRYSIGGRIIANRFASTAVQLSGHFAYFNELAVRENGVCKNPEFVLRSADQLDGFLRKHGVTTERNYWRVEKLNIHFIPKEFQHHGESFDERFCFVGALLNRPFVPKWINRSGGKPIVLISAISALRGMNMNDGQYYSRFANALSGSEYHCILSVGPELELEGIPSHVEINRHASHLEILPHAALSISHGGMGTTLEAIHHGVPALLMPSSVSCREVAYRAQELGLGISLDSSTLSDDQIRESVAQVLADSSLVERVKTACGSFRKSGGSPLAADRIEASL